MTAELEEVVLLEFLADIILQPGCGIQCIVCQDTYQSRISDIVAALHDIVVELICTVFDSLCLLDIIARCSDFTAGYQCVSADYAFLFQNDNGSTVLFCSNCCTKTSAAGTDNNNVIICIDCFRSCRFCCSSGSSECGNIHTGRFHGCFDCLDDGIGCDRSTCYSINIQRLCIDNLTRDCINSICTDAFCFLVVCDFNLFDLVRTQGYFNRDIAVAAGCCSGIGSRCVLACSFRCLSCRGAAACTQRYCHERTKQNIPKAFHLFLL